MTVEQNKHYPNAESRYGSRKRKSSVSVQTDPLKEDTEEEDTDQGLYKIANNVFIQSETGLIQSVFYRGDENRTRDIRNDMLAENFSTLCSQTLKVSGKKKDEVTIKTKIEQPREVTREFRFAIEEVISEPKHEIQILSTLHRDLSDYNGFVEGSYSIQCNTEERSSRLLKKWPFTSDQPEPRITYNIAGSNVTIT